MIKREIDSIFEYLFSSEFYYKNILEVVKKKVEVSHSKNIFWQKFKFSTQKFAI